MPRAPRHDAERGGDVGRFSPLANASFRSSVWDFRRVEIPRGIEGERFGGHVVHLQLCGHRLGPRDVPPLAALVAATEQDHDGGAAPVAVTA